MRKYFHVLLVLCFLLACSGCGEQKTLPSPSPETSLVSDIQTLYPDGTLTYTNLVSKSVQQEVQETLLSSGIRRQYIDTFFMWVDDFNQCMKDCESFTLIEDWTTAQIPVVDYGEYAPMSHLWFKQNNRRYSDILCRIAAFQLMQDNITVVHPIRQQDWECYTDTQWLYSDWDAISNFPLIDFDTAQNETYFTLYHPVTIPANCSGEEMYQKIQAAWNNCGITFSAGGASLITIWTQYQQQAIAAHAAVLITDGAEYLLVEKTNPQSPYQATRFSSIEQVKQYMYESIHIDDMRYGNQTGTYIVLRNDELL